MQKSFKFLVMTPEKDFFNDDVTQVIVCTPDGEMGIMAEHMPMIAVVAESMLRFEAGGHWKSAAIGKGFLEMISGIAELFVDSAEWAEDIDVTRCEAALDRAQERLHGHLSHSEYLRTHAAVARAKARINASKRR